MAKIFISYRRSDNAYVPHFLRDRLAERFGPDAVFIDVDSIPLGADFVDYIDRQVARCDVLLAMIGDGWLDAAFADGPNRGRRRLDDPGDYVRVEIASALARDVPVIPVLMDAATMPAERRLPAALRPLARRNAAQVRPGRDLQADIDRLIRGIEQLVPAAYGPAPKPPPVPPAKDRREEQRRREQERQEVLRRQVEGERLLAELVADSLNRRGVLTAEDNAAANDLIRRHGISADRARQVIARARQRWQQEQRRAEPERRGGCVSAVLQLLGRMVSVTVRVLGLLLLLFLLVVAGLWVYLGLWMPSGDTNRPQYSPDAGFQTNDTPWEPKKEPEYPGPPPEYSEPKTPLTDPEPKKEPEFPGPPPQIPPTAPRLE